MDLGSALQWTKEVNEERRQSNALASTMEAEEEDGLVRLFHAVQSSLRLLLIWLRLSHSQLLSCCFPGLQLDASLWLPALPSMPTRSATALTKNGSDTASKLECMGIECLGISSSLHEELIADLKKLRTFIRDPKRPAETPPIKILMFAVNLAGFSQGVSCSHNERSKLVLHESFYLLFSAQLGSAPASSFLQRRSCCQAHALAQAKDIQSGSREHLDSYLSHATGVLQS